MVAEILKLILPLLGGGLAGALLNEWIRRRRDKLQAIPLIERVNRLISPELEGFTLARRTGDPSHPILEEIQNAREYQFTLFNTSTNHLQAAEIQFEFPTEDMEAWATRPALSKTALIKVDPGVSEPWRRGFRWRIPYLPSGDSVEFGFKAVNPPSPDFEVALYNVESVVITRSKGEPTDTDPKRRRRSITLLSLFSIWAALVFWLLSHPPFNLREAERVSVVGDSRCTFAIYSSYGRLPTKEPIELLAGGPWQVSNRLLNTGLGPCVVESVQFGDGTVVVGPRSSLVKTLVTFSKPEPMTYKLSFGPERPDGTTSVELFGEPERR